MKHYKYIFIILTYRNTSDVLECINSINKFIVNKKIVLVNSHYDENSTEIIRSISENHDCDFIDVENKGYGYGNNCGIRFAKENYSFDYLVISNPDITIQKFDDSFIDIHNDCVIAPKITTIKGKKQNPYWYRQNRFAERLVYFGYKQKNSLELVIGFGLTKIERELGLLIYKIRHLDSMQVSGAHGSFCIFPKSVLKKLNPLYDEKMFLFAEESYLAHAFEDHHVKVIYTDSISVLHKEDGSIKLAKINEDDIARKSVIYYYEKYLKK